MNLLDVLKMMGLSNNNPPEEIKEFKDLDKSSKELVQCAIKAREFAYVPYSGFKVGAAFRTKSGRIYSGCNVENAAFSPSCCAERTALTKAVSEGCREFVAGAVVAYQPDGFTPPCGVCRQFIMEFANKDIPIYITKAEDGKQKTDTDPVLCTSIYNLLPSGFKNYK